MKKSKKTWRLNRKAWIEPDMMESGAFRSLSKKQLLVLLRFQQKITWSGRGNRMVYHCDDLAFTYAEAEYLGISRSTFHRSLKALVEKGFIDIEHQGGAYGRDYSRYALSNRWKKYGTEKFEKVSKNRVLQQGLDVQARTKVKIKEEARKANRSTKRKIKE
ncbi:MAG: hypothetical protein V3W52_13570 [Syntrophobacteria bacterium]